MSDETIVLAVPGPDGKVTEVAVPREVLFDAVKDTHTPTTKFEADMNRRVQAIIKNQKLVKADDLLLDEEHVRAIAERHNLVRKEAAAAGDDDAARQLLRDALQKQKDDIERTVVAPLRKAVEDGNARSDALLARDLEREIEAAAREAGIRKALLRGVNGKPSAIVSMLSGDFAFDEETGRFYQADDNDQFIVSTGSGDNTYKTIEERVREFASDPANVDFVETDMQGGPGVGGGSPSRTRGGAPGIVTLTEEQAADTPTWQKALASVGGDLTRLKVKRRDPLTY